MRLKDYLKEKQPVTKQIRKIKNSRSDELRIDDRLVRGLMHDDSYQCKSGIKQTRWRKF